jgi:hypothetical protein
VKGAERPFYCIDFFCWQIGRFAAYLAQKNWGGRPFLGKKTAVGPVRTPYFVSLTDSV